MIQDEARRGTRPPIVSYSLSMVAGPLGTGGVVMVKSSSRSTYKGGGGRMEVERVLEKR
jgi:hypothetical protein